MAESLHQFMDRWLQGWQIDLPSAWRPLFKDFELPVDAIDRSLSVEDGEVIYPGRRHHALPGAPEGAHLFRAFEGIAPAEVRCVLLGQDPYPDVRFATGRAFEAGAYDHWSDLNGMASHSMRSLIQCVYAARRGDPSFAQGVAQWPCALAAVSDPGNRFPGPGALAQHWVDQGVLLLNSSLTLSRFSVDGHPHQTKGHIPLWRPFVAHVIRHLLDAESRPVIFILFGNAACKAAAQGGLTGNFDDSNHPWVVAAPHPAAGNAFLRRRNPFIECNRKLEHMNQAPIDW